MDVIDNLREVKANIQQACEKVGRNPADVHIIAVTKYVSTERTREAIDCGLEDIGENRPEGLLEKRQALADRAVKWHFIGSLQSRKVKDVLPNIDFIHSLDRLSLAKEIENRAEEPIGCFLQVNVSGEASKHGLSEDEILPFIEKLSVFSNIRIVGLMTMAPYIDDKESLRAIFKRLKEWQERIKQEAYPHAPCLELSMGMSNDYTIAIEEGATYVRIGTALVGNEG